MMLFYKLNQYVTLFISLNILRSPLLIKFISRILKVNRPYYWFIVIGVTTEFIIWTRSIVL